MAFKHFLITRFNIVCEQYKVDKKGNSVQTEDWLANRFSLFEKYCLPSVINQSTDNFIWLVVFNSETPDYYKQKIKQYQSQFKSFIPLFLEPYKNLNSFLINNIKQYIDKEEYIITTRLDNDDAIHKEFITLIQKEFQFQDNIYIAFTKGMQYDEEKRMLYFIFYSHNHFISRIEKIKNLKTVFEGDDKHNNIHEFGRVKSQVMSPTWIEVVHKGNVVNSLWNKAPHKKIKVKEDYHIDLEYGNYYLHFLFYCYKRALYKAKRLLKLK